MVLCQRPYDIGDRIATSYPYIDTSTTGSSDWIVRDVNLYSTTVVYGSTNELATHSNGALSTLRIINATRSPRACLSFHLKFPINTSYAMIEVFKLAMEKFVRARSREVRVCVHVQRFAFECRTETDSFSSAGPPPSGFVSLRYASMRSKQI